MDGVQLTGAYERQSLALSANFQLQSQQQLLNRAPGTGQEGKAPGDVVAIGSGSTVNINLSMEIVVERAYARLSGKLSGDGVAVPADQQAIPDLGDYSPDAVSSRIVDFATHFLGNYLDNHKDQQQNDAVAGFEKLIRDAIDEGFRQARDILNAMSALSPDIGGLIDQTYQSVLDKLDAFFAQLRQGQGGDTVDLSSGGEMTQLEYYQERTSISFSLTYTQQSQTVQGNSAGQNVNVAA